MAKYLVKQPVDYGEGRKEPGTEIDILVKDGQALEDAGLIARVASLDEDEKQALKVNETGDPTDADANAKATAEATGDKDQGTPVQPGSEDAKVTPPEDKGKKGK